MIQSKYLATRMHNPSNKCQRVDTASTVRLVKMQRSTAGCRAATGIRAREQKQGQKPLRDGGH